MPRPAYIVFEGIDGSGVTTHSKTLASRLDRRGHHVMLVKEPSLGVVGSLIWETLTGLYPSLRHNPVLALLFAADRVHQLYYASPPPSPEERSDEWGDVLAKAAKREGQLLGGVFGALARGFTVVSDRGKYSSLAYQSTGPEAVSLELLREINSFAAPPHVLVYLDVPAEVAARRLIETREEVQLYEKLEEQRLVRERYLEIIRGLMEEPEYCPGRREAPPWASILLEAELSPSRFYPEAGCYPAVVVVRETNEKGEERPREEVTEDVEAAVLAALHKLGLLETLPARARERLENAKSKGYVELKVERMGR